MSDKNKDKREDDKKECPLCNISEETLDKLKQADKNKKQAENK